ncbi:hypothetical protein YM80_003668 [Salmonella enterica subsp. salamae]|uniref:Uncharacterized protein n=1 Tax=Salmonella enterica subsp. salamae TaxID=59202 RepID=A0A5Y2S8G3_SALER|nr:hypothetical protein [Salmonella enterica subsp. salamae]ECJ2314380.1 hypothetical protein [Salmonella enterica subsp. salamae]EDV0263029.1 hypothetical protein [Salmonella enterica subsp. salamae]
MSGAAPAPCSAGLWASRAGAAAPAGTPAAPAAFSLPARGTDRCHSARPACDRPARSLSSQRRHGRQRAPLRYILLPD